MSISRVLISQRFLGIAILVFFTSAGFAQDEEGFSGRAGLGYLATSGNSDNRSINANFDLWWNYAPWGHSLRGDVIKSSSSGTTTAEASSFAWQSKYDLNDADYLFGLLSYNANEFGTYDRQTRGTVGYGRRFLNTEKHILSAEIGIGARQSDLRDGTSQDSTIGYLGANYRWAISESSEFTQSLGIESGSDNTHIEATSRLSAKVRENLALSIGYTIKNNSDVLPGTEKTDTFTTISLDYAF